MKSIKFINDPKLYNPTNAFVVHLSGISSEGQLFNELNNKIKFPDYFGFNWNAVYDCLRDFHWIKQKKIVLIHDELPKLNQEILSTYLRVLAAAVQDWQAEDKHYLEVVFPQAVESLVGMCLSYEQDLSSK